MYLLTERNYFMDKVNVVGWMCPSTTHKVLNISQYDCIRRGAFKEVMKVEWPPRGGGAHLIWPVSLEEKEIRTQTSTVVRTCEDKGRRQTSTNKERGVTRKPTLLTPWSCTSILQNCEEINFSCLSWWYFVMAVLVKYYSCPLQNLFHNF